MSFGLILCRFWNGRFHEDELRYSHENGPLLKVAAEKKKPKKNRRESGQRRRDVIDLGQMTILLDWESEIQYSPHKCINLISLQMSVVLHTVRVYVCSYIKRGHYVFTLGFPSLWGHIWVLDLKIEDICWKWGFLCWSSLLQWRLLGLGFRLKVTIRLRLSLGNMSICQCGPCLTHITNIFV